ncbi:MAG: hypothetical protein HQK97_07540 [Nitrospirae bacterium]|nr:hypothetical protein [Nitrospirota bacterium]
MRDTALFPEKEYRIGDKVITLRPLSFYELMVTLPGVVNRIFEATVGAGVEITPGAIMEKAGGEVLLLLNAVTGKDDEFWKCVPVEKGLEIVSDFVEMNITENFTSALSRAIQTVKQTGLTLSSSLSGKGTPTATSEATQSAK